MARKWWRTACQAVYLVKDGIVIRIMVSVTNIKSSGEEVRTMPSQCHPIPWHVRFASRGSRGTPNLPPLCRHISVNMQNRINKIKLWYFLLYFNVHSHSETSPVDKRIGEEWKRIQLKASDWWHNGRVRVRVRIRTANGWGETGIVSAHPPCPYRNVCTYLLCRWIKSQNLAAVLVHTILHTGPIQRYYYLSRRHSLCYLCWTANLGPIAQRNRKRTKINQFLFNVMLVI